MTVVLLPDVERLLSSFLRDQDEVTDLVDDRVYTAMPADKDWPLVRLTRFAGAPVYSRPLHLDVAVVQVDAFGGSKNLAWQIAETCRAVIAERLVGSQVEGVVSKVEFGSFGYHPDDTFPKPQPKFDFLVTVWCHPGPSLDRGYASYRGGY